MDAAGSSRVFPATRAGIAVLIVLAVANGVFLYLLPWRAAGDYAWRIVPSINAAVLGAGYLAGAFAAALAYRARHWRAFGALPAALIALSLVELVATIVHHDRFKWGYAPTALWTLVYAGIPPFSAYLWWRQAGADGERPPRDETLGPVARISIAAAFVLGALALVLFVSPGTAVDHWPWTITPLLARAFAGWYALAATMLLGTALTARRPSELPIAYATIGLWSVLLLPLPALYSSAVTAAEATLWLWLALHLGLAGLCGWTLARVTRREAAQPGAVVA